MERSNECTLSLAIEARSVGEFADCMADESAFIMFGLETDYAFRVLMHFGCRGGYRPMLPGYKSGILAMVSKWDEKRNCRVTKWQMMDGGTVLMLDKPKKQLKA